MNAGQAAMLTLQGIFTTDLTLRQIKTLRAKERIATRVNNSDYNYFYEIPTLQEYIDIVKSADHVVGVVPETKYAHTIMAEHAILQ